MKSSSNLKHCENEDETLSLGISESIDSGRGGT